MSMNKSCDSLDYFGFTDLIRKKLNEDDLNLKLKQVREVTNCSEEFAIITLHDCNYNVEYAINKILTHDIPNEGEWKTKKGKQKKIPSKEKDLDNCQELPKEKIQNVQDVNLEKEIETCDKKLNNQNKKEFITLGKTFKNFNLPKKLNSNFLIHDYQSKITNKPEINFLINGKWNEKSIIIENSNYSPMPVKDIMILKTNKTMSNESRQSSINTIDKKDQEDDSSIVFKTTCTTKPPPKVLCSLVAPVQIINTTLKHNSLPKFKFGDTDLIEELKKPNSSFNLEASHKIMSSEPKFVDIEDNSIIKVGPSQKIINNLPNCSFSPDMFNQSHQFFNQNNYPVKAQSNLNNNIKQQEFAIKKLNDMPEYAYMNMHQHTQPAANLLNCSNNLSSINSFASSISSKELTNNVKSQELYLNHSSPIGYSPQPNVNHVKSTIYLVPNVMMNPINGLYMTVNNPVPASALSPPMGPLPSQFNIQQSPQVYFEESLQTEEKNLLAMRQQHFQSNRPHYQRYKKPVVELSDEVVIKNDFSQKANLKTLTGIPLNQQNAMPKQIPFANNYPLYISSAAPSASHAQSQMFINNPINSNSFNHYPHNYQPQESNNNENVRKRNIQMQNGNFHGKAWS